MDVEIKKRRLRGPNFTKSESILLCNIVQKYKNIIENKKTDGCNLLQKAGVWLEVTKIFNSSTSGCERTTESLQHNYKNLKKKLKKSAYHAKMNVPADTFLDRVENYGTTPEGWKKASENLGVPGNVCQELLNNLKIEADEKDEMLKKKMMGTGEPPPQNDDNSVLDKINSLVSPSVDGIYTNYDAETKKELELPIETMNYEIDTQVEDSKEVAVEFSTNDRSNLKKKRHHLLTRKRKLESEVPQKQSVTNKFCDLAEEKLRLVQLQKELLQYQISEEKEKLEHNRMLRAMELEDAKKYYKHQETMRQSRPS